MKQSFYLFGSSFPNNNYIYIFLRYNLHQSVIITVSVILIREGSYYHQSIVIRFFQTGVIITSLLWMISSIGFKIHIPESLILEQSFLNVETNDGCLISASKIFLL